MFTLRSREEIFTIIEVVPVFKERINLFGDWSSTDSGSSFRGDNLEISFLKVHIFFLEVEELTITALEYIETMKINGLSDEITIKTIPRGATVVIDGETGFVTMDGENKFKDVEMFEFPYLKTGKDKEHHIIFSDKNAIVTIQYKPMWL